jgi:uncharacterized protein (TIGR02453 family)
MPEFSGFPVAALDFYDDLEMDNSRSFWEANKHIWLESVKTPMTTLTDALAAEFGTAKIFRPYRDVRFAKDKTPFKTHQGAFVAVGVSTGWYVQIGAPGVRVGAGYYEASGARLAAIRAAIDNELTGPALESLLDGLRADRWEVGGERLKTSPRGYGADHPRIELLRHKSLSVGKDYGFDEDIHKAGLADRVRDDWRAAKPLLTWLEDAAGEA